MQVVKKIFLLFVALVAIVSVVMKHSIENERMNICVKSASSQTADETEKVPADLAYIASYEAIVPVFHLQLHHDFQFVIFELELLQETDQDVDFEIPQFFNKFCRTLFRLIISPNAP